MIECDEDTPVPEWVIEHPETLALFRELGIDYCCGGKSLAFACQEQGHNVTSVLSKVRQWIQNGGEHAAVQTNAVLESIQVGRPRQFGQEDAADPMDRLWTTGFYKEPVNGPVRLGVTNLDGDGQADLVHHGGTEKAVLAYADDHYHLWRPELNMPNLAFGAFGENFTVQGITEANVCLGDVWKIGDEVRVQVSQPRQPCWKLARRWRLKTLALQVQSTGRTGWYFRVLAEGAVAAGMPMMLVERPHPAWTVERANRVMHFDKDDLRAAAELAAIPTLALSWTTALQRRVECQIQSDPAKRLYGPNVS